MSNSVINCTVIILKPFHVNDEELFKLTFGQVYEAEEPLKAIELGKSQNNEQPTLLIVDLDAIEQHVQFLTDITRDLPKHIPLIVCSKNESRQFMLDCIQVGATDYLLKPLSSNVIKTLFLRVAHKCVPEQEPLREINTQNAQINKILEDAFTPRRTLMNQPNISKERSQELEAIMSSWDFSPFELSLEELVHIVYLILNKVLISPELQFISITKAQLYDFIIDLAGVYHDENPYHNFAHAVDVMQCLYYILKELNVFEKKRKSNSNNRPQDVLRPKDVLALLIAAIGHDAAHPGVNNMFLINSCHPLAKLYNDESVLESLHSMTLFQLLDKHGVTQFFDTTNDYKEFRKVIVSSILATDMAHHSDYVFKIKEQTKQYQRKQKTENEDKERLLLCCALIKCADISNVARPFRRGERWAQLLIEEFVSQGDLEKELGLPVLPMNDRNQVILEETQIGFIRFVALDLFQNVREILKELSFAVEQMQMNLKQWETRKSDNTSWTVHDSGVEQDSMDHSSMLLKTVKSLNNQFEYEEFTQKRDSCCLCLIQ